MFIGVAPPILRFPLAAILKPQDVFRPTLFTTTGNAQPVTTGLDFLNKGGFLWEKVRSSAGPNLLTDTLRGNKTLQSETTGAEANGFGGYPGFTSTGYVVPSGFYSAGLDVIAWPFLFAPKFCVEVTWTGDGTSNRQIPHGLGVAPGMIVMKRRDATTLWPVYHRSINANNYLSLNTTDSVGQVASIWNNTEPTATVFTIGSAYNASNGLYVAYLFAHDPSADGIVQCGSSTADGSGVFTIPHGWAGGAQWLIYKRVDNTGGWFMADTARSGANFASNSDPFLLANSPNAEFSIDQLSQSAGVLTVANGNASAQFVWAIIRAPY